MFCVKCGYGISDGFTVCPKCGAEVPGTEKQRRDALRGIEPGLDYNLSNNKNLRLDSVFKLTDDEKEGLNAAFRICESSLNKRLETLTIVGIVILACGVPILFLNFLGILFVAAGIIMIVIGSTAKRKSTAAAFFDAFDKILDTWEKAFKKSVCSSSQYETGQQICGIGAFTEDSREKLSDPVRGPIGSVYEGVELFFDHEKLSGYRFIIEIPNYSCRLIDSFEFAVDELLFNATSLRESEYLVEFGDVTNHVTIDTYMMEEEIEDLKQLVEANGGTSTIVRA